MNQLIKRLGLLFGFAGLAVTSGVLAGNLEVDNFVDPITYASAPVKDRILRAGEDEGADVDKIIIHYHNEDAKNDTRSFWIWSTAQGCDENMKPDSVSADKKDMQITVDFTKDKYKDLKDPLGFYVIVKYTDTWAGQTNDKFVDYATFAPDDNKTVEIWTIPGVGQDLDVFKTEEETKSDKVTETYFTDYKTIKVFATAKPNKYRLYSFDQAYLAMDGTSQDANKHTRLLLEGDTVSTTKTKDGVTFTLKLNYYIHVNVQYVLETEYPDRGDIHNEGKVSAANVGFHQLYELGQTKTSTANCRFVKYYNYSGNDLGVTYTKEKSTFKLWAPTAGIVTLNIYNNGVGKAMDAKEGGSFKQTYQMSYMQGGVWAAEVTGDLNGKYYTYSIVNSAGKSEVVDPYAKACGANGYRGMILDFDSTDPEGWDAIDGDWNKKTGNFKLDTPQQLAIYESHVRDLTMHETWGGPAALKGTYKGYALSGTVYTKGTTTVKTGFDHLVELGINAIQFTPVYDHDNTEFLRRVEKVDEKTGEITYSVDRGGYNWGYNPLNYNCVEGQYSTDPLNGETRVREFKELILKMASVKEGNTPTPIRAIMDVVYNHVSSGSNSNFTKIMPRYYFRMTDAGEFYNGSGCGNEVKSEAPMMSKFIVESLCWWAREYNIKGFRFDLMGLIDYKTIKEAATQLYKIDPSIYLYGEGWTGDGSEAHVNKNKYSTWGSRTYDVYNVLKPTANQCVIGCFNDYGRNQLRGGNDRGWGDSTRLPGWGFMSQGTGDVGSKSSDVGWMLCGKNSNPNDGLPSVAAHSTASKQTVNYASCHDNYSLFDQFCGTLADDGEQYPDASAVARAVTATNMAIFMSNGVAFMQGGEELFRTKVVSEADAKILRNPEDFVLLNGIKVAHNAYKCEDIPTNAFDYSRKIEFSYKTTTNKVSDVKSTYFDQLATVIKLRRSLKYVPYAENEDAGGTKNNFWNASDGSTGIGYYNANGYIIVLCGRGSTVPCGAENAIANVGVTVSGGHCSGKYGAVVFKTA